MESVLAGRTHQFLRSEYIQPPPEPASLDAKKSPLALLAQTCSAIGKETPSKHSNEKRNDTIIENGLTKRGSTENSKSDNGFAKKSFHVDALKNKDIHQNVARTQSSITSTYEKHSMPTRKLSAPVFSKTDMASVARPHRTSPTILMSQEQSQIGRRTLASTPMGVSDVSSPDITDGKKSADKICQEEYSPARSNANRNGKASESNTSRRNSRSFSGSVNDPDVVLSTVRANVSPPSGQQSNNKCRCTGVNDPNSRKSESSVYTTKFKPNSYSLPSSGCYGCQLSHVPGSCESMRVKETDFYYPLYPLESSAASQVELQSALSYNRVQSQIMAAIAARNEYLTPGDTNSHVHICKWVTATEGHCGKAFGTREGLVEHLSTHALPSSSVNNFPVPSFPQSSLATYFGGSPFSNPSGFGGLSSSLTQVAIANERLLQSSQRRCNPLNRYNPYKGPYGSSFNSYVPIFPSNVASSGLFNSPYSFYGQPVGAAASGYLYP